MVNFWHNTPVYHRLKAAPRDDINFRFQFCNKVVYPPDQDFFFQSFQIKKKFINISMNLLKTQTNFLYI